MGYSWYRWQRYFITMGEQASSELEAGAQHAAWLGRLNHEQDNLWAALRWCVEVGDVDRGLQLGGALWRYWFIEGARSEVREWLQAMLRMLGDGGGQPLLRARALTGAGVLTSQLGEYDAAEALHNEGLALARELGDGPRIAANLHNLGWQALRRREYSRARTLLEEAVSTARAAGDRGRELISLNALASLAADQGNYAAARNAHSQAAAAYEELGDTRGMAQALAMQGLVTAVQGDLASARTLCETALSLARESQNNRAVAWACLDLAFVRVHQHDYSAARALCVEALRLHDGSDHARWWVASALRGLASVAASTGEAERALRLFGAAQAVARPSTGKPAHCHRPAPIPVQRVSTRATSSSSSTASSPTRSVEVRLPALAILDLAAR